MKKLLMAGVITLVGISALGGYSYADVSDAMKNSKYCRNNSYDPLCMGPESMGMRAKMMEMTKERAMENRSKYCQDSASADDPICNEKMMNDTTGF